MASPEPFIDEYFNFIDKVGKGSYSTVYKVIEKRTGKIFALKKLKPKPKNKEVPDFEVAAHCVLKHENIAKLHGKFICKRDSSTYLIFDFYDYDMFSIIYNNASERPSYDLIKSLTLQLLKAVDVCHKHNVLHRDIKPENILITKNGVLKLSDFGYANKGDAILHKSTNAITPSYRPPEILLGDSHYSFPSDIWSVGCVIYELITSKHLFKPTDFSPSSQLDKILSIIGKPKNIDNVKYPNISMLNNIPDYDAHLDEVLDQEISNEFLEFKDLLKKIFVFNPSDRLTASQLLQLPMFNSQFIPIVPIKFYISENVSQPIESSPELKYGPVVRPTLPKLVL